jgi:hypothetical protein
LRRLGAGGQTKVVLFDLGGVFGRPGSMLLFFEKPE